MWVWASVLEKMVLPIMRILSMITTLVGRANVARAKGATEVLGPGYKGHSGHVHMAWPR